MGSEGHVPTTLCYAATGLKQQQLVRSPAGWPARLSRAFALAQCLAPHACLLLWYWWPWQHRRQHWYDGCCEKVLMLALLGL